VTPRVVLDTNVLVSGLGWSGPSSRIVDAALAGRCTLITSHALIDELRRVVLYPKLASVFSDPYEIVRLVEHIAEMSYPKRTVQVVSDEADNRVLEAAVEAACDYIVTGDNALLALVEFEGIAVVAPAKFAALLSLEWYAASGRHPRAHELSSLQDLPTPADLLDYGHDRGDCSPVRRLRRPLELRRPGSY
jgi:putative PIN family toxin of toxin-antitoxin system